MSENEKASKSLRLNQYNRRVTLTNWVGGGYLGIIGIISADVLDESPFIFVCIVVTLVIFGSFAAAQTRVRYEWAATLLIRHTKNKSDKIPKKYKPLPKRAEFYWIIATIFLFISGLVLLAGVWYKVIVDNSVPLKNIFYPELCSSYIIDKF